MFSMKKILVFILALILILNLSFAAETRRLYITDCFDINIIDRDESCFTAQPKTLSDCDLIPKDINNYESIITKCHANSMSFDSESCDLLKLNQTYKDDCFSQSNNCEKIIDSNKKELCINKVNKNNFDSQINTIIEFILLAFYLLSPLGIIIIILKTIFDLIKKNKFSIAKRITLIILLLLLWFFIVSITCFPPCYIAY